MDVFVWEIIGETDDYRFETGMQVSLHKVSDLEIRDFLKSVVEANNVDIISTDIIHLAFVASTREKDCYYEELNPLLFWPKQPKDFGQKNKNKFRIFDSDKKGGEKERNGKNVNITDNHKDYL